MALALVVNFTVAEGNEQKTIELIRRMEEHTRREPGCRQYIGHQSVEDPRRFFFYELYEDEAALESHRNSPHYDQYVNKGLRDLMATRITGLFNTVQ